jgi:hypothetical protein
MSDNESAVDDSPSHIVLDTEKLIFELEKWPALYDKKLIEYSDRNLKEKLFSFAFFFWISYGVIRQSHKYFR